MNDIYTLKRMTDARAMILKENPFFGRLALGLTLATAQCDTACTDGERLIFDSKFAERLSDKEMQFVILHEIMHCVLNHCFRSKSLNNLLFNIACDIVVNSIILEMWGIDSFIVDGEEAMHLTPNKKEGRLYNAEEVYHMLLSDGSSISDQKSQGSKTSHDNSNISEASCGNDLSKLPSGQFDRHDIWNGIVDNERLKDVWNKKINTTAKQLGNSIECPQHIRDIMDRLKAGVSIDWKEILHSFLQFDDYDYYFNPPDSRYSASDLILPSYSINYDEFTVNSVFICIDTSGSVSDDELAGTMSEIRDALIQANLTGRISFFDSRITDPVPLEGIMDYGKLLPKGGGGTNYHSIFNYIRENMIKSLPTAVIIFTDGYADWPSEEETLGVPVLWMISKGGRTNAPFGKVCKLP